MTLIYSENKKNNTLLKKRCYFYHAIKKQKDINKATNN